MKKGKYEIEKVKTEKKVNDAFKTKAYRLDDIILSAGNDDDVHSRNVQIGPSTRSVIEFIRSRVVSLSRAGKLLAELLVVCIASPKALRDLQALAGRSNSPRSHGGGHLQTHFERKLISRWAQMQVIQKKSDSARSEFFGTRARELPGEKCTI
jgi:hypothetical protein